MKIKRLKKHAKLPKHSGFKAKVRASAVRFRDSDVKTPISIRLDKDVVDYFRDNFSPGYQSEINRVLRKHVEKELV